MDNGGEMEVLLVLCCLVGVVVFLCFSMGALNLSTQMGLDLPVAEAFSPGALERSIERLQREIAAQEEDLARRRQQLSEDQWRLSRVLGLDQELVTLEQRRKALTAESELSARELERLRKSLDESRQRNETTVREFQALREKLAQLDAQMAAQREALAAAGQVQRDVERLRALREESAELDRQIAASKQKLQFSPEGEPYISVRLLVRSRLRFQQPLYLECDSEGILVQPQRERITASAANMKELAALISRKTDGVVILLRPNGYESFQAIFPEVTRRKLPVVYEAVNQNWQIKF